MSTFSRDSQRHSAREALIGALAPLDGVRSVRFVGSYWEPDATVAPGDVDVVVILSALTRPRFEACVAAVRAIDGKAAIRRILPISLTFDHRVVTGGEAARFLAEVIADLQRPT